MAVEFTVPGLSELHERAVRSYKNRFPAADVSLESDNWKRTRVTAEVGSAILAYLDWVFKQLLPGQDMVDTYAERWGAILNVSRKQPTPAKKGDALRVFGTASSTQASGSELTHSDGTRYQLGELATIPAGGFVDVDVIAIDTGSKTRKTAGEVLTFSSPSAGIEPSATLQKSMDEDGDDLEELGIYIERLLDKLASPGMGGNAHDYVTWANEVVGIANAYVYPLRQGLGSVDLAALHSGRGAVRILDSGEMTELKTYIDDRRPVAYEDFRVLTVTAEYLDFEARIKAVDDTNAWDWNDQTPLVTHGSTPWDSATRKLKFTTNRPADMQIGDRVIIKNTGTENDGAQIAIEAFGSNADEVILASSPLKEDGTVVDAEAGVSVYSGGSLVDNAREGILKLYDLIGPGRDSTSEPGAWEGSLRLASAFKTVQLADGVLDCEIILPSATTNGSSVPPNPTVGLILPRRTIIRRWW